jgi:putative FmdB family regulatory protein
MPIRGFQGDSSAATGRFRRTPSALLGSADTVPIYEYVCMECESHFEELVRNGEEPDCPDCASANVRKQFSVFATHGTAEQPSFGGSSGGCCGGSCGCG